MILTGFIRFLDPAKPSAKPTKEALKKLEVNLKVLTEGNEIVTCKICTDLGISIKNIVLGNILENISEGNSINGYDAIKKSDDILFTKNKMNFKTPW